MKRFLFCLLLSVLFSCPALANVPVTGITLNKDITFGTIIGERGQLTATITPADATDKRVVWSSSSDDVVIVHEGLVIARRAPGYAIITVVTVDGGFSAECGIIVHDYDPMINLEERENIVAAKPQYSSDKEYAASKMTFINEDYLDITEGKVILSDSAIKKLYRESSIFATPLPWFEAAVDTGKIAAIRIPVKGTQFNEDDCPRMTTIQNIMTNYSHLNNMWYAVNEVEYCDGKWTLMAKGSEDPYTGFVESDSEYDLMMFIKDGGSLDLDETVNGFVIGLPVIMKSFMLFADDPSTSENNDGGCVTGLSYAILIISGIVLLTINRKKRCN